TSAAPTDQVGAAEGVIKNPEFEAKHRRGFGGRFGDKPGVPTLPRPPRAPAQSVATPPPPPAPPKPRQQSIKKALRDAEPQARAEGVSPKEIVGEQIADSLGGGKVYADQIQHAKDPPILPWFEPPAPASSAGGKGGGGFTATGHTNTQLGDLAEAAVS